MLVERLPVAALQRRQLLSPTDHRRQGPLGHIHARPATDPEHTPDRHRLGLALDLDGGELLVGEHCLGGPPGRLPAGESHQRLAGVDADPHRQLERGMGPVQLGNRIQHAQRAPHRPLRVVLVNRRDAEHRHDGVTDELVQGAADALDLTTQPGVERAKHGPYVLGIGPIRACSEPDQVTEEDRDDLALLARWVPRRGRQR